MINHSIYKFLKEYERPVLSFRPFYPPGAPDTELFSLKRIPGLRLLDSEMKDHKTTVAA
jgi:hypothetical protein